MNRMLVGLAIGVLIATGASAVSVDSATAAPGNVLILASTVTGGAGSIEADEVSAQGLTPVVVDDATWTAMSAADFASFRAIVLGDPTCSEAVPAAAEANVRTWGPVVNGNVLINGTDPVFHRGQGGEKLTRKAIDFAVADAGKTGLYISLSCYYHDRPAKTAVPVLDALRPGAFTVTGVGCYDDAHIVATHPALDGLTDADLSGWGCSVHEAFDSWPADFTVLAMAKDFGAAFTASDGSVGTPYILASGQGLRSFPLSVTPSRGEAGIGTTYTVTATLLDAATHAPVPGKILRASAVDSGGGVAVATVLQCSTSLCASDATGEVAFSYSSNSVGDDVITVWQDADVDDRIDPGEAQVRALVTWTKGSALKWLALGDSYSAGVGGAPAPSDDEPANTACRTHEKQSYSGQARTAAEASGHQVVFQFAACMNAVTSDILTRSQAGTDQFAQIEYVKAIKPDIVTLTVGGNDIRFPSIATGCVINSVVPWLVGCGVDSDAMKLADQQKGERDSWDGLYDRLVKTYVAVRKAQPPSGHLYVSSYPVPFAGIKDWRLSAIALNCHTFSWQETRLANAMAVRLGDTIYQATRAANKQLGKTGNVHFVDWRPHVTTQRINGRDQRVAYDSAGLCTDKKQKVWTMNGLLLIPPTGYDLHDSFHPTKVGYAEGAKQLTRELRRYSW
jgi:hypothetical protein